MGERAANGRRLRAAYPPSWAAQMCGVRRSTCYAPSHEDPYRRQAALRSSRDAPPGCRSGEAHVPAGRPGYRREALLESEAAAVFDLHSSAVLWETLAEPPDVALAAVHQALSP